MLIKDGNQPSGLGYFVVDQRASGIPVFGGNALFEADTYTCSHCNTVVILNPHRKRERYKCGGCNHNVCDPCAAELAQGKLCRTMAQVVDEIKEQALKNT